MKFTITKKFMVAKVESKGSVNLYTLLDVDNFEKFVSIGSQHIKGVQEREIVEAEINLRTTSERLVLKTGETKFIDVLNTYVTDLRPVKTNG